MRCLPDAIRRRVPDAPSWVDTRGLLESGHADVIVPPNTNPEHDGFLIVLPWRAVVSVVGAVPPEVLARTVDSLDGDVNVLAQPADAAAVAAALPGWQPHVALLHTLPADVGWRDGAEPDTTMFDAATAPPLDHLPTALRDEIEAALNGHPTTRFLGGRLPPTTPGDRRRGAVVAAAWADGRAAGFCYAVTETAAWWDVSVETAPAYRRRGLAGRAARAMIRHQWARARAPVWGAIEDNVPSLRLAARLGFREAGRLAVFTCRA